jgi:hypothetical protein
MGSKQAMRCRKKRALKMGVVSMVRMMGGEIAVIIIGSLNDIIPNPWG